MPDTLDPIRERLVYAMLPMVPFDGWSEYTLLQAAKQERITVEQSRRAFTQGAASCIDYFLKMQDTALTQAFPPSALEGRRIPEKIETLMMAKLERLGKYREAVRRALAQLALPWHAGMALKALYRSVDTMWRLAGDTSIDFSFYTKRATLAGIYSSTLLYWLNDESDDLTDTKSFLKRRLADVAAFGKRTKALKEKFRVTI